MAVSDWNAYFQSAGQQYGVDPDLLRAIATVESSGNANAVSAAGAVGPMQLMPDTAKALGVSDPTDPSQAIPAAARLLSQNNQQMGGLDGAVLAYHGGTNQANWGPKTRAYYNKVATTYQQLKNGSQMASNSQPASSDDAFTAAFGPAPAPVAAAASKKPAQSGQDAFSAAFEPMSATGMSAPLAYPPGDSRNGPAEVTVGVPTAQPSMLKSASAGVVQGLRNVISSVDPIQQWVDKKIGPITLGGLLPTGDQAHAANVLARNQFNKQYGNNSAAQIGQVGGEIVGSLPALAAGGEILAPVGEAIGSAAPIAAPAVDFVSGASGGNRLLSLASKGAAGALQGGAAGAITSGGSDQSVGQQIQQGAEFGGGLGAAFPAASGALRSGYNRLTGGGVPTPIAQLADKAVNTFGIPLRGSQISQSPFMRYLDSAVGKMPLSGMEGQNEAQRTAFSRAVAGTFGEDADNLTPQVMSNARTRIGNVFDRVAANTTISPQATGNMANTFAQIEGDAQQVMGPNEYSPIKRQMDTILSKVSPAGEIDGATYQALTRKGAPLDSALSSKDPNIRQYAGQIRSALDDALQASANPQDLADLKTARLQWKNMRTVQDLASKAGIEGEISPSLLLGAVKKSYKDMPYSGAGPIGDLAHIGQQFLKEPPSSGTGERAALYSMLGLGGETLGEAMHDPNVLLNRGAALGGLIGAGRLIGSGLKNRAYRDMLLNSVGSGQGTLNSLLGRPGVQQVVSHEIGKYAIPSTVIGGNQLFFKRSPVASLP